MKKEKKHNPSEKLTLETKTLTKRQQEILDYIVEFTSEAGYPPTVRDIAKGVGLSSSSTVHFHLNALEDKGFIQRDPSKPRALKTNVNIHKRDLHFDNKDGQNQASDGSNTIRTSKGNDSLLINEPCSLDEIEDSKENKEKIITKELEENDKLDKKTCSKVSKEKISDNSIGKESVLEEVSQEISEANGKEMIMETIQEEESIEDSLSPIKYLGCEIAPFPIVNNAAKDNPLTDHQLEAGFLPLPLSLTKGKEGFIMSMEGDSMSGIGINHGDLCFFQKTETFKDGDVSALYANGQLTVKKIYGHMGLYRLEPENRKMNPVYVKNVKVLGKLAGVIKTYL